MDSVRWIHEDLRKLSQASQTRRGWGRRVHGAAHRRGAVGVTWASVHRHSGGVGNPWHRVRLGEKVVATYQTIGGTERGKSLSGNSREPTIARAIEVPPLPAR